MESTLVTVMTFYLPQDAYMARNLLESENIEVFLQNELTIQENNLYSNAVGGVILQVLNTNAERAVKLLTEGGYIKSDALQEDTPVEELSLKAGMDLKHCPYCQSDNIGKKRDANSLTWFVYMILGLFFPIFKTNYICFDCKKEWKFKKK